MFWMPLTGHSSSLTLKLHSGVFLASNEPDSFDALHVGPAKLNLTVAREKLGAQ